MKQLSDYLGERARLIAWLILVTAALSWLLLHKLGTLTGGLSAGELAASRAPVGWHGIYHSPLYLPLKLLRSLVFYFFPAHGQTLTRLPNTVFGGLAVIAFIWLIRLWHGWRTAILAGALFATGAWTLHASRLASFDVLYLWAMPSLLLWHVLLNRYGKESVVWYAALVSWGLMLYIPGLVWLLLVEFVLLRGAFVRAAGYFGRWWSSFYILIGIGGLSLLAFDLRRPGELLKWLGAPHHFGTLQHIIKQFAAVPLHLFLRGPQYPDIWLGRAPLLDVFTLGACFIGVYFYLTHLKAPRSRLLGLMAAVGVILVALGGPVGLSLLVPLLYVGAATGIAYLLREWLQVFPNNPLARGLGVCLIALLVCLGCVYNLRAYFVAWPHNGAARATFRYHR